MHKDIEAIVKNLAAKMKEEACFTNYIQAKEDVKQNPLESALLHSYKQLASKLQLAAVQGAEANEEDIKLFEGIAQSAFANETIANYIHNELAVKNLLSQIIEHLCKQLHIEY